MFNDRAGLSAEKTGLRAGLVARHRRSQAAVQSWEDHLSAERHPLGVSSARARSDDITARGNRASGHMRRDGAWPGGEAPAARGCFGAGGMRVSDG